MKSRLSAAMMSRGCHDGVAYLWVGKLRRVKFVCRARKTAKCVCVPVCVGQGGGVELGFWGRRQFGANSV